MTLKIGFLTIGEGGSNIGEYAAQKGFPVIAINSAKIDLDKLKVIPKDCRIHLEGWEGAGRNREIGRDAVIAHAETIFEKAKTKFNDCDMIFVVASTAGGTGSGGLQVGIEIVSDLKEFVGAIAILPESKESPKAHMNALECFSELSKYQQLSSVFVIDNERAKDIIGGTDKTKIYQESNRQIIDNIASIAALTDQSSFVSNFDKNDCLAILNERGCTMISKVQIPINEIKQPLDIVVKIRESWEYVVSPELGHGQIVKAAVLGRIPREMTSIIDTKAIFEETGIPYDIVEAYYPNNEHQNHAIFYTMLSGLSFPMDRLKELEKGIQAIEQELVDKSELSRNQHFETGDWNSKFKRTIKVEHEKKPSLSERLSKFK
jgi:cell division GTPase FtsZ